MADYCFPKADLGFDPTPRPSHCWHPMASWGVPFALPDSAEDFEHWFCCRCHFTKTNIPAVDRPYTSVGPSAPPEGGAE